MAKFLLEKTVMILIPAVKILINGIESLYGNQKHNSIKKNVNATEEYKCTKQKMRNSIKNIFS